MQYGDAYPEHAVGAGGGVYQGVLDGLQDCVDVATILSERVAHDFIHAHVVTTAVGEGHVVGGVRYQENFLSKLEEFLQA